MIETDTQTGGAAADGRGRERSVLADRCADDSGFTPAEIIIGVILLAILSTSVVAQALELRQQAQDAAAQTTLRSAVAAARGAYALTLPGGVNNFVAVTNLGDFADETAMSAQAVETLGQQEPNINFVSYYSQSAGSGASAGRVRNMDPSTTTVWVEMPADDIQAKEASKLNITKNPNKLSVGLSTSVAVGTKIRTGDIIRLGMVAASGSSFCAILVADSSNGSVSGIGFQSVNESSTIGGWGADCGAKEAADESFREMPGTTGTDSSLSRPVNVTGATDSYGGNATGA